MFYPRCYLRTLPVLCRSRDCGAQASPNSSLVKMCEEGKRRQQELLHRSLADLEGVRHSPRSESRSRRIQPDVCDSERAHVHAPVATRSLLLEINLSKAISAHRGDSGCSSRVPIPCTEHASPPHHNQVLVCICLVLLSAWRASHTNKDWGRCYGATRLTSMRGWCRFWVLLGCLQGRSANT